MSKLTLSHPIQLEKSKITDLHFREYATAEDLLAFDEPGQTRQTIFLIASLTGTDEALIRRLHVNDFRKADAIASRLIAPEQSEKNELES